MSFSPRRGRASASALAAFCLLAAIAFCALIGAMLLDARRTNWDRASQLARNTSRAVASELAQTIEGIDLSLRAVTENSQVPGVAALEPHLRNLILFDRSATAKHLGAIVLIDEDGRATLNSRTTAPDPANYAATEGFIYHRDHPDGGLFISRPRRGLNSGNWLLAFSREMPREAGRFQGVANATLYLESLGRIFDRMQLGKDGTLVLLRDDGIILQRTPFREPLIGGDVSATPVFRQVLTDPDGEFIATTTFDGIERLYVATRIEGTSLNLLASLSVAEIEAPWRRQAWITGLVTLCLLLASVAAAWRLRQHMRLRRLAELAARDAAAEATALRDAAMADRAAAEQGRTLAERARGLEEENRRLAESRAQAAAQLARQRSEILAIMAHEIRTPLTGVIGFAELLAAAPLPAEHHEAAEAVLQSGQVLLAVVNDLLDLAKLDAGKISIENIPFAPATVLRHALALTQALAAEKGLAITLDAAPDLPLMATGDPTRLRQVVGNLLSNAVKFTPEGGVTLRARVLGPTGTCGTLLLVEVLDSGIGIPAEALGRLFTMFEQADSGTARRFGGTGLGLAICKRLVEAMQGRIGAESERGQGSRFWFELPLGPAPALVPVAADPAPLLVVTREPRSVLVVDDVAANRALVQAHLTRAGHAVTLAADGAAAVEAAMAQSFDLILMDVHMPVMDGIEAARRIRAGGGPNATTPIIALTADVTKDLRPRLLQAGIESFLTKPAGRAALLAAVASFAEVEPSAMPDTPAAPVLDLAMIAELDNSLGRTEREAIFDEGLAETTRDVAGLSALLEQPAALGELAHRVANGLLPLGAVAASSAARRLEVAARRGAAPIELAALLDTLEKAMAALRTAMPH